tara:strand:+ start:1431 stop:1859 length:429 start_codon:yes stop_codon:yes gene_type:complete
MLNENFKVTGQVTIQKNGEVVRDIPNTIVTAGKNDIASLITGAGSVMTHMAVGTGTNAVAAGDTTLQTESDRNALSTSGGSPSTNTVTYTAVWNAGDGTGSLTEAGLFSASSSGTMLARTVFSAVNKGASDVLTITWTITVS